MKVTFNLKVKQAFVNKEDQSVVFKEGDTLTTSDLARVNHLVSNGLCLIESAEAEPISDKGKGNKEQGKEADKEKPEDGQGEAKDEDNKKDK